MTAAGAAGLDEPSVVLTRDSAAIITYVGDEIVDMLGWTAADLMGRPSTDFIHPEDQPSAVAVWMTMLTTPGSTGVWRGRYRAADGAWRWVETINENLLDGPSEIVRTTMKRVTGAQVTVEEELRKRTELLSRLSDALPVGLVQIDGRRMITFSNDQLHTIVGPNDAATIDALFGGAAPTDRASIDAAVTAVLDGRPVDDLELRLDEPVRRTCTLSLRALTDGESSVTGAIGCLADVTDRVQLRRELEIRASVDTLTGCLNRASTLDLLSVSLATHDGMTGTAAVFIDLDRFKSINDILGHAAGDRLLIEAAERLCAAVRSVDRVGRIGGDEFLVICPGVESARIAREIGERLARVLHARIDVGTGVVDLEASIGVAWTAEPVDADSFVAQADAAMYECKRDGTAVATFFETPES